MDKDYYAILGVDPDATLEEIKAAYRHKAKTLHPDRYTGGSEPFRDLHEAYTVLSDPDCRQAYDEERALEQRRATTRATRVNRANEGREMWVDPMRSPRSTRSAPVEPLAPDSGARPAPIQDPFDEIVGRLWGDLGFDAVFPQQSPSSAAESVDFTVDVPLTSRQARRGGRVRVSLPLQSRCPVCQGQGRMGFYRCGYCQGDGVVEEMYPILITFDTGVADGETVIVSLDQLGIPGRRLVVQFKMVR